jgi:hypothetical protein
VGTIAANSAGHWTLSPIAALAADNVITAKAIVLGKCVSAASTGVTVQKNIICASYAGDLFANTSSTSTGGTANVILKFTISASGGCNNVNALTAPNFTITADQTGVSYGTKQYLAGVLTIPATINLPSNAYSETVQFTLGVNNSNLCLVIV